VKYRRGYVMLVFLAAFSCLLFELIISRIADFHLDSRNSFIAIPITFLGLALGSLHVHFRNKIVERFNVRLNLVLLATVAFLTLLLVFFIFSRYMTVTGAYSVMNTLRHSLNKSAFFAVVFLVPFYFFGRVLTVCYHLNRDRIGTIYGADLFGASLACLLTPILFHVFNLPGVLFAFTCGLSILILVFLRLAWRTAVGLLVLLVALNGSFLYFITYADNHTDFRDFFSGEGGGGVKEITHAWNEFSRVSVVTIERGGTSRYKIIHDNAQSNVEVAKYTPGSFRTAREVGGVDTLFLRGRPVRDVMVMFAGCGAQMIPFHVLSGGAAHITGVELNPLVRELAVNTPELESFALREFLALPNVDLRIMEGRSFLVRNQCKFDVIFVGSKAPTNVQLTGHSRKYLDTVEAFGLYLDHLRDGGVLFFNHQPLGDAIETLKRVFLMRGLPDFAQSAITLRAGRSFDLMVSPQGFSLEDVQRLVNADRNNVIDYAPYVRTQGGRFAGAITSPVDPKTKPVTDDRPFIWDLDFRDYRLVPDANQIRDDYYYFNWTRITILLVLALFSLFFIALACLRRSSRPPIATLAYLLITGFCYLLVEIVFMARLELFLQDLLVSMATTLSVFLLASGVGSSLSRVFAGRVSMRVFPFFVALLVAGSVFSLDFVIHHLLALPLFLRIVVVVMLILPVGVCLGMFYPLAVAGLVRHGFENAVPITYGISTLSSVVGATYAMTMMLEIGYSQLLYQAAVGYATLGLVVLLYSVFAGQNVFDLRD